MLVTVLTPFQTFKEVLERERGSARSGLAVKELVNRVRYRVDIERLIKNKVR
jgi:hypothetical protein